MSERLLQQLTVGLRQRLGERPDQHAEGALAHATALGLPVAGQEQWRYSALRTLERALATASNESPQRAESLPTEQLQLPIWSGSEIEHGDARRGPDQAFAWLARAAGCQSLHIERSPERPLYLDALDGIETALPHRHRRLQIAAGVQLTVIEHLRDPDSGSFANLFQEVEIGAGAQVHWLRLVEGSTRLHLVARSEFDLAANAHLIHHSFELGGAWSRHDLRLRLGGKGASVQTHGLLPVAGKRHVDTQLEIIHAFGDSRSQALWRGVAADRSRAVFNGRILIEAGADGSDAALNTSSLLLSPHAEIDAKPELEIYADAVKASHGAAIGQLDPQALFYMRSRGLPLAQARQLLMTSFCRHVLEDLDPAALAIVEPRLEQAIAALHQGAES